MRKIRKWFILFSFMAAMILIMPQKAVKAANTSGSFEQRISQLQQKFPAGKYWNHTPGTANNSDGYTSNPCTHHGNGYCSSKGYTGWCGCNSFASAIQCKGFAFKLAYDTFGTSPRNWSKHTNISNVMPGDVLCYKSGGHTIFVTGVSGNTITYADCNSAGPCKIRWNATISKSNVYGLESILHATNYNEVITTPPAPPAPQSPIGNIDVVTGENNSIRVRGWAFDPQNPSESIHVHVYVGGEAGNGGTGYNIVANKERTDVGNDYGVGNNHGFDETIAVDKVGSQSVHFYAIGKQMSYLGAVTTTIKQRPVGSIDAVQGGVDSVFVGGWAFDPDEPSKQTNIHVYIGGPAGSGAPRYIIKADKEREDVGKLYGVGNYHGFTEVIKTSVTGNQKVYFYAIDTEGKEPAYLGERAVTIKQGNHAPVGVIDKIKGGIDSIKISGWAYDTDYIFKPVTVDVYIGGPAGSGAPCYRIMADKERKDVGISEKVGDYHGYSETIKTNVSGKQKVYIYALDIGGDLNPLLGIKEVEIKKGNSPDGYIDSITGGKGVIKLHGWAYDADDISQTVTIHVYVGGEAGSGAPGYVIKANKERKDLGALYKVGDYHGYEETITTDKRGTQEVFVYAIDVASNQPNPFLGSRKVTIGEPDHVHKYTSKVIKVATCTSEGERQFTCSCGNSYKEAIAKAAHTIVTDRAQPAACTTAGKTEGTHCSVCNTVLKAQTVVPATGHNNTEVKSRKTPACEEDGYTGDICCKDCGMVVEKGRAIDALGHDYDAGVITREPTMFEDGIKTHTCTRCGSQGMEIIPWDGPGGDEPHTHAYTEEITKPSTCAEEGEKTYTCACGESYMEPIPRLAHNWDVGTVTKPATETEDGIRTYTCTQCGETKEEGIPATGQQEPPHTHAYTEEITKPSTCAEEGEKTYTCACGESYMEPIPRLAHSWDVGTVTKPATETEDGIRTYTCTQCGETKEEGIPATGQQEPPHTHAYTEEITKPATCAEEGEKTYTCTCGESYTETIPQTAHIWDNGVVTKPATETESGTKTFTCIICSAKRTETIPPTGKPIVTDPENPGKDPVDEDVLEKGDIIYDHSKTAVYKVISIKGNAVKVEYIGPRKKKASAITIPDTIRTKEGVLCSVSSIAANACKGNKYLKKLVVGKNITKIGNKAFAGCKNLSSVSLGKNLTSIGNGAFDGCARLAKITIPEKVAKIGSNAFHDCKKLKSMTIKTKKLTTYTIGKNAFKRTYAKLTVRIPRSKAKAYKKLFRRKGLSARTKIITY